MQSSASAITRTSVLLSSSVLVPETSSYASKVLHLNGKWLTSKELYSMRKSMHVARYTSRVKDTTSAVGPMMLFRPIAHAQTLTSLVKGKL